MKLQETIRIIENIKDYASAKEICTAAGAKIEDVKKLGILQPLHFMGQPTDKHFKSHSIKLINDFQSLINLGYKTKKANAEIKASEHFLYYEALTNYYNENRRLDRYYAAANNNTLPKPIFQN